MTYHNVCGWFNPPQLQEGDTIDGGNLYSWIAPTDINISIYRATLVGKKEDYPPNVYIDESCIFAQTNVEAEPIEPIPDYELASMAMATRALLAQSNKLQSPEITAYLDSLEAKQKEVAGVNPSSGESATLLVRKMIESLRSKKENDKADELQQALDSVIDMTGGIL